MYICHTCDNPSCCNPGHLFLGTGQDNALDRMKKNRGAAGERHGNSKLTSNIVRDIRKELAGGASGSFLAWKYNVTAVTISDIKLGKTWSHI